jgi:fatty-acyl-CoA synthase
MYVVPRPGHDLSAEALQAHLARTVAKWWLPDEVLFVDDLPHYATGKVMKDVLRSKYAAAASAKKASSN